MLGVIRSSPSACALAFGAPRLFNAPIFQGRVLSSTHRSRAIDTLRVRSFQTRRRTLCVWAAATEAVLESDRTELEAEELENELDALRAQEHNGGDGEEEDTSEELPSPARLSLLQSNMEILKHDCGVEQLLLEAATCRANRLYLGLDISTRSTGYAVLRPSALPISPMSTFGDDINSGNVIENIDCIDGGHSEAEEGLLRTAGLAELLEWGCIAGSASDNKKKDVVDVGVIVEEALRDVATRCRPSSGRGGAKGGDGREGVPSQSLSPPPLSPQSRDDEDSQDGLGVNGSAGSEGGERGPAWVVGVEDFMRRFLPGRSNAKSIFALAQLNGIVKYACQKHLGAKADSFHPSTPRSFYGLTRDKPEGKEMKHIVHDFALSQEDGALESRYDWPLMSDGSKADGCYDITDAYLVALYSWHRDIFRAVADNKLAKDRFAEAFRLQHAKNLAAAEERSIKLYMEGNMPAARGKKTLKPMTERSARNAHRKVQDARFTKAYETALMHWFKQQVLGTGS